MRVGREAMGFARGLRGRMTPAEVILWGGLRKGALGARFRRQHPVVPYTLDFACVGLRLAVEVDGPTHLGGDAARNGFLAGLGWRVVRFSSDEVFGGLGGSFGADFGDCRGSGGGVSARLGLPAFHRGERQEVFLLLFVHKKKVFLLKGRFKSASPPLRLPP